MDHVHRSLAVALMFLPVTNVFAAFERMPLGPRQAVLGVRYGTVAEAVVAVVPGTDALPTGGRMSVFLAPRLHGCDGLSFGGAAAALPAFGTMTMLAGTRLGCAGYRELLCSAGCSLPVAGTFCAGCAVNYLYLSIAGYGSASALGVDAALAVSLGELACYYCAAFNLNAPVIGSSRDRLPQALVSGVVISPFSQVAVTLEAVKDLSRDLELRAGAECTLSRHVVVLAGMAPAAATFGVGCVIRYGQLALEYGLTHHRELGATHWLSLQWCGE